MKPVDQTILASNTSWGNCLPACIASILEIPLHWVPHFILRKDDGWHEDFEAWAKWSGYDLRLIGARRPSPPGEYVIASGVSPRGIGHACVALDGKIVHDPHPSRGGLAEINSYWVLAKN